VRIDIVSRSVASTAGTHAVLGEPIRRLFIAGNSRSGTTMLAKMLGRHSAFHTLPELHFVEELWQPGEDGPLERGAAAAMAARLLHNERDWYHNRMQAGSHTAEATSLVEDLPDPIRPVDVLSAVLARAARRAKAPIAVEQTPRNVFFLADLLDALPGSRAVVITRDPRDVLLSQRNWWRRRFLGTTGLPWRTTVRQWADYHPITTSLIWRSGVRAAAALADDARVTHLRFEDLVTGG
jgi:hypothetical protein